MARIAVVGAGGIGAVFGGHWQLAGHDVLFCARRPFSRLVVESRSAPVDTVVSCVTDPSAVPVGRCPADWVFVAVKAQQTPAIRPWLDRLVGARTKVVALQNGLDSAQALGDLVGGSPVLDSVVYCGAQLIGPGRVRHGGGLDIVVRAGEQAEELRALSPDGPVTIRPSHDFVTDKWRKVLVNSAANGTTALTRRTMGVFGDEAGLRVAVALLAEGVDVARAHGARLEPADTARILADLGRPEAASVAPSMLQDRLAGRPTESDAIYGAVTRAAARVGLAAPLHRFVHDLLAAGDR